VTIIYGAAFGSSAITICRGARRERWTEIPFAIRFLTRIAILRPEKTNNEKPVVRIVRGQLSYSMVRKRRTNELLKKKKLKKLPGVAAVSVSDRGMIFRRSRVRYRSVHDPRRNRRRNPPALVLTGIRFVCSCLRGRSTRAFYSFLHTGAYKLCLAGVASTENVPRPKTS